MLRVILLCLLEAESFGWDVKVRERLATVAIFWVAKAVKAHLTQLARVSFFSGYIQNRSVGMPFRERKG